MEFKLAIGDKTGTYKAEIKEADAEKLVGKKISDKFKGELLGLAGYEFEITGGSDNAGFPMRRDVDGPTRKKAVLTGGVGFHSKRKGLRRRKSVRGNTISGDIVQVNCKVIKAGTKKLADVLGAPGKKEAEGEAKEEKPQEETPKAEEKKEDKVEEKKEEVKEEKPAKEEKETEVKEELEEKKVEKKEEAKPVEKEDKDASKKE